MTLQPTLTPELSTSSALALACQAIAARAKAASQELAEVSTEQKDAWLRRSAVLLREQRASILQANQQDLQAAQNSDFTAAEIDRLRLTDAGLEKIAQALDEIAILPDPVRETIEKTTRPNGLQITKVRVPLGVVFFIYESRPNVTADAAAICIKSGNAVILRGGKEAAHSSAAIVRLMTQAAKEIGLPTDALQLVDTPDRDAITHFLRLSQYIDLAIPRGGEGLIRLVAKQATMPVIKHYTGNCHVYIDRAADLEMAETVTINAKCQRMGVCNAAESLLIHAQIAETFLPRIGQSLAAHQIEIRGDARTCQIIPHAVPATETDYQTEFLGPVISCKVVESLEEAILHINHYGSHHTDAIITADEQAANQFTRRIDSSAVMVNASTRFNDGHEFGLGAEIGISTDRFHARGPCGLRELTTYKYLVRGSGQVRS